MKIKLQKLGLWTAVLLALLLSAYGGRRWWKQQPYTVEFRQAAVQIDAQGKIYERLLAGQLVPALEVLGNPAASRYPDCAMSFARNPWDLTVYDKRLFIGLGDSSNDGPSANAGPVPVLTFEPEGTQFTHEAMLDEEQIDRFYSFGAELLIPGDDPRESWHWGNLYQRSPSGNWQKFRNLPRTIHTHALALHQGQLFAGVSVTDAVPAGVGSERYGSAVAISPDQGHSWQLLTLGGWRIFDFLQVQGRLYATDVFPGPGMQRWLDTEQRQTYHAGVYEYAADGQFQRRLDLNAEVLFPQAPLVGRRLAFVQHAAAWKQGSVYIGAFAAPVGVTAVRYAYWARNLDPYQVDVQPLAMPAGAIAWDLMVEKNEMLLLLATPLPEGRWRNSVQASPDGTTWHELLHFEAPTFARAFVRWGDDLYFGLGISSPPRTGECTLAQQVSGSLLRARGVLLKEAHP